MFYCSHSTHSTDIGCRKRLHQRDQWICIRKQAVFLMNNFTVKFIAVSWHHSYFGFCIILYQGAAIQCNGCSEVNNSGLTIRSIIIQQPDDLYPWQSPKPVLFTALQLSENSSAVKVTVPHQSLVLVLCSHFCFCSSVTIQINADTTRGNVDGVWYANLREAT